MATPEDLDDIRSCAARAYRRYVAAIARPPAPMIADFEAQISDELIRVAVQENGKLAGFITFYPVAGYMHLENVAVDPEASGRGIGKALIAHCEAAARAAGLAGVRLYTNEKMNDNLSIYPRLGYAQTDRRVEDGFKRVYFEKSFSEP